MEPELRRLGAPDSERARSEAVPPVRSAPTVEPTVLMEDGDTPDIPGWDLTAVWTPGHTPGHLCFWEAGCRLMLTGDCVLSSLSSGVSLSPTSGPDPLCAYLDSLARLGDFDVDEALPAHEFRFRNYGARLLELRAFHEARFADILAALPDGDDTAWAIASRLQWERPWHQMGDLMRRVAIGETNAHLRALAERGVLEEVDGEPVRWRIIGAIEHVPVLVR
jgi:glyoxylase-like metal-dependent hydrolase (beta-lactamase superfamily II)